MTVRQDDGPATGATTGPPVGAAAPSFSHLDPGTAPAAWSSWLGSGVDAAAAAGRRWPAVPDDTDLERLVVVAAHPDDETLGAGGLIAAAAARGVEVTVLIATAGEGSHPGSPTLTPDRLAALRVAEARAAVGELAPTAALAVLHLPDGGLADLVAVITGAVERRVGPRGGGVWLVAPWREDGHPDHRAVGLAAAEVAHRTGCRLLEYPIWAWHWGDPAAAPFPETQLVAVPLPEAARAAKRRALDEYRSQVLPLSPAPGDEPVVPPGFREHFTGDRELFIVDAADPGDGAGTQPASGAGDRVPADPVGGTGLGADYFDAMYAADADPWGFTERWYEQRKRAVLLAALPRPRFRAAFEPGCSIGVLTRELGLRCDTVLAADISETPLAAARTRTADLPGVRIERRRLPHDWPYGRFDLIVLSEIGYYCTEAQLTELAGRAAGALDPDGVLVACHWRHPVADYPLDGDRVHEILRATSGLQPLVRHLEADFRLEVFVRPAAAGGTVGPELDR
ncbi:PIG-L family deacetylase [Nakamurella leprariae]|uniref:Bifunctional PIG-L family deacetylase/class I SAM-dependent methyltransferase n=1 Tax=Nakamurella leprariae TaxID=2803911 RepID=A0A938YCD9_9ACTN|nr:bifunctional PIG-L family deacetylase/class I SAM-dependent methyltransferase [Nakamurella leprariae]MBM9468047.1 bifunctional PIG-L family deacetylase/class I SAM-dependent methyltransferase [Nakamurella leprariae]